MDHKKAAYSAQREAAIACMGKFVDVLIERIKDYEPEDASMVLGSLFETEHLHNGAIISDPDEDGESLHIPITIMFHFRGPMNNEQFKELLSKEGWQSGTIEDGELVTN